MRFHPRSTFYHDQGLTLCLHISLFASTQFIDIDPRNAHILDGNAPNLVDECVCPPAFLASYEHIQMHIRTHTNTHTHTHTHSLTHSHTHATVAPPLMYMRLPCAFLPDAECTKRRLRRLEGWTSSLQALDQTGTLPSTSQGLR